MSYLVRSWPPCRLDCKCRFLGCTCRGWSRWGRYTGPPPRYTLPPSSPPGTRTGPSHTPRYRCTARGRNLQRDRHGWLSDVHACITRVHWSAAVCWLGDRSNLPWVGLRSLITASVPIQQILKLSPSLSFSLAHTHKCMHICTYPTPPQLPPYPHTHTHTHTTAYPLLCFNLLKHYLSPATTATQEL